MTELVDYMRKPLPSQKILAELFEYEAETGNLVWKNPPKHNSKLKGKKAGTTSKGYVSVRINGSAFQAHRIIYKLLLDIDAGPKDIDHIDEDRSNNKLDNLRLIDHRSNVQLYYLNRNTLTTDKQKRLRLQLT